MSVLGTQKLKVAAQKRNKMQLDAQHITTSTFMQLQPVYYRHLIPNEKISISVNSLTRLQPMAVPTFGRANLNLRCFFVPYKTVCPYFNSFVADTYYSSASTSDIPQTVPYFNSATLWKLFKSVLFSTSTATKPTVYDFFDGTNYYTLTVYGKRMYKIFLSLGYRVFPHDSSGDNITFNALALLSFARVYFDWYSLSQYRNSSSILALQKLFAKNDPSSAYELTYADLISLCGLFEAANYGQDYFTSAWENPVNATNGSQSQFAADDLTYQPGVLSVVTGVNNTPTLVSNGGLEPSASPNHAEVPITEYSLHLLHALNNYTVRHSMAGAREIDRLLVDFGIQLRSERLTRSVFIGSDIEPLQIGDVTQTVNNASGGNPSNLGDYGGKGYIKGQKSFDYEAEEFGMIIICATIQPAVSYVQGIDRHNLDTDRFDFFNPSFDSLGTQAIAKGELYTSPNFSFVSGHDNTVLGYKDTWGFSPRYAHRKVGRDWVSGDFAVDSANIGRTSWFLSRLFVDSSFDASNPDVDHMYHSLDFCRGVDAAQYNRIFNYTGSAIEPFYMFFNFNVTSYMPALPLYDTYQFEGEENHDSVTIDVGGTKLN